MNSFKKKIRFFRGLLSGETARTGPFFVAFDIIGRCNLKCIGCPFHTPLLSHDPPEKDFPPELFQRLCNELADLDTRTVVLQGAGEPLLHPDLFPMIRTVKSKHFEVVLLTNGTLLDRTMCRNLLDSGTDILKVSLWAASPEEFTKNYPGTPSKVFDRIIRGVRTLSELKKIHNAKRPVLLIHYVINRNNYQNIGNLVALAQESGCDGIDFSVMHDSSRAVDSIMLNKEEVRNVCRNLKQMEKQLNRLGLIHNIQDVRFRYRIGEYVLDRVPCTIPWVHVRVRLNGHVYPCNRCVPDVDFGDVHTQQFQEIWNGPAIRDFRKLTMKRGAGSAMMQKCNCRYCCFVCENKRVHRIFRWFRPFVSSRN